MLKGVWTALPTVFTADGRLDEAGNAANLEHCIGNVGEFWSMTNEERMRLAEINAEAAKGRIPLIAGCHHRNPAEAMKLAQHAQSAGIDFVIILTPYVAARSRATARRVDYGFIFCRNHSVGISRPMPSARAAS